MSMANLHPSCPSSLLLLLAGSVGHGAPSPSCRPAPLGQPGKKEFLCCPHTAPTSEQSQLAEPGYLGPSPHEWHSSDPHGTGQVGTGTLRDMCALLPVPHSVCLALPWSCSTSMALM